jgi:hypothetical protein
MLDTNTNRPMKHCRHTSAGCHCISSARLILSATARRLHCYLMMQILICLCLLVCMRKPLQVECKTWRRFGRESKQQQLSSASLKSYASSMKMNAKMLSSRRWQKRQATGVLSTPHGLVHQVSCSCCLILLTCAMHGFSTQHRNHLCRVHAAAVLWSRCTAYC